MKRKHKIIRTKGQRIALMNTSPIPDKEIIAAIKFVANEIDLDATVVHFKKMGERRRTYGRAYYHIPYEANMNGLDLMEWSFLIIVTDHGHGKLTTDVMNTLGHEAKHIEQFRRGTLRREKKARNCEAQACAFGSWMAERWLGGTVAS